MYFNICVLIPIRHCNTFTGHLIPLCVLILYETPNTAAKAEIKDVAAYKMEIERLGGKLKAADAEVAMQKISERYL